MKKLIKAITKRRTPKYDFYPGMTLTDEMERRMEQIQHKAFLHARQF